MKLFLFKLLFERLDATTAISLQVTYGLWLTLEGDGYTRLFDFHTALCNAIDTVHNGNLFSDHNKKI